MSLFYILIKYPKYLKGLFDTIYLSVRLFDSFGCTKVNVGRQVLGNQCRQQQNKRQTFFNILY